MKLIWWVTIAGFLLVITAAAATLFLGFGSDGFFPKQLTASGDSIIFLGDIHPGESYLPTISKSKQKLLKKTKFKHSFTALQPLASSASFTLANLEAPITTRKDPLEGKNYIHFTTPETSNLLTWFGVDAVSLANNHSKDQGESGLKDTFDELRRLNITWTGAGRGEREAWRPLIIKFQLPNGEPRTIAIISLFEYREVYDKKFQFYAKGVRSGVADASVEKVATQVRQIRNDSPEAKIIAFTHWGKNYKWATEAQKRQARDYVDAGVDMIIGHGSHMMQEIETYKNRWILYGIGNSIFNAPGRYQKRGVKPCSLIVKYNLSDESLKLYPINSDNLQTGYQPRTTTQKEFDLCRELLFERSHPRYSADMVSHAQDEHGFYIEINLD